MYTRNRIIMNQVESCGIMWNHAMESCVWNHAYGIMPWNEVESCNGITRMESSELKQSNHVKSHGIM